MFGDARTSGQRAGMSILIRSIPLLAVTAVLGLSAGPAVAGAGHHGGSAHHHGSKATRTCGLDRVWLKHVAQADLAEIAAGTLAQQKGTSEGVKALGTMLVTDHTKHLQQVQALAARVGVKLPTAPAPWQQWQAAVLESLSGTAFDQQWAAAQVADHLTNIDETQDEIADGCNRKVRALAAATLPVLQMHLAEAQKLVTGATGTGAASTPGGTDTGISGDANTGSPCAPSDGSGNDRTSSSGRHHQDDDACCNDDQHSGATNS
jgi:putative membrane protein